MSSVLAVWQTTISPAFLQKVNVRRTVLLRLAQDPHLGMLGRVRPPLCFHLHTADVAQVVIGIQHVGEGVHDELGDVLDIRDLFLTPTATLSHDAANAEREPGVLAPHRRIDARDLSHLLFVGGIVAAAPGLHALGR